MCLQTFLNLKNTIKLTFLQIFLANYVDFGLKVDNFQKKNLILTLRTSKKRRQRY